MKPTRKKPESTIDRIDRLEHSLALAHLSIKRLQDHLRCLEHDKTKLVREIQALKNGDSTPSHVWNPPNPPFKYYPVVRPDQWIYHTTSY